MGGVKALSFSSGCSLLTGIEDGEIGSERWSGLEERVTVVTTEEKFVVNVVVVVVVMDSLVPSRSVLARTLTKQPLASGKKAASSDRATCNLSDAF